MTSVLNSLRGAWRRLYVEITKDTWICLNWACYDTLLSDVKEHVTDSLQHCKLYAMDGSQTQKPLLITNESTFNSLLPRKTLIDGRTMEYLVISVRRATPRT